MAFEGRTSRQQMEVTTMTITMTTRKVSTASGSLES
jgi:hypothetical protein